ncbi:Lipoyl synthase [Frankliniella fusca]|uniref:Lipoyl synthase n=1 Tax=Frankliniella fusca TaxID=407009 RepID=A0AAE1GWH7_9NEOP|nr:Lipoyl synthase [Frankliniella fusca]
MPHVICSSCERLVHQGSCSFSTCRETYMCHKCSFAQRLGLSESALMEINAGSYLSDEHVNIASSMLKEQFGAKFHGLNPPLPVRHNNEIVNELQYPILICGDKDYVQIMHTGNQHWVTCIFQTASPNTAIVPDSLRKTKLSSFLCLQVAMVACSKEESITICRKPCQQQRGSVDCALFAIAQATEFCSTSEIRFIDFDQSKLREHWMSCVRAGKLTRFPAISSRPKKTL